MLDALTTMFVSFDGLYYLCCSEWRKQAPPGSVFDTDTGAEAQREFEHFASGGRCARVATWIR